MLPCCNKTIVLCVSTAREKPLEEVAPVQGNFVHSPATQARDSCNPFDSTHPSKTHSRSRSPVCVYSSVRPPVSPSVCLWQFRPRTP